MSFPVSKRSIFKKSFKSYTNCFCCLTGALCYAIIIVGSTENVDRHIWGCSQAGKAPDFDSGMRRFESCHPCHDDKSILIRTRKNEKTGEITRFLPFFRACFFRNFITHSNPTIWRFLFDENKPIRQMISSFQDRSVL